MNSGLLERLGLTKGETKVYLSLNKLRVSTIGPICKLSNVSKSKVYDILNRLIDKGLVGHTTRNKINYFTANDPTMLIEYLHRKESELNNTKEELNTLIPSLIAERKGFDKKLVGEIYDGFEGIKAIREELMMTFKKGDTLLVLGAPRVANVRWEGWFLDFHKRRIKRGISMKIVYNYDARDYGRIRSNMKLTKVRYLSNKLISPNWIDVFHEAVLFVMLIDKNPIAFVVRDKDLANSFKAYFEIMWKISML